MVGVHFKEVPAYGRCPLRGGVCLCKVSTKRCLFMQGDDLDVCLWEVST